MKSSILSRTATAVTATVAIIPSVHAISSASLRVIQSADRLCLDIPNGNQYDGAVVQGWTCAPVENYNQHFFIQHYENNDNVRIRAIQRGDSAGTDYCMSVDNNVNGERVRLRPCNDWDAKQKWREDRGAWRVRSIAFPGKCLDFDPEGRKAQIWDCGEGAPAKNQGIRFEFGCMENCNDGSAWHACKPSNCVDGYPDGGSGPNPPPGPGPNPGPLQPVPGGAQGSGKTTRYWDCCKPTCAWPGSTGPVTKAAKICAKSGAVLGNNDITSSCGGGGVTGPEDGVAYMCTDNQPWVVSNDLAYGFAAAAIPGVRETRHCCACYELTFTSGPVSGKRMVVQVTNTGGDLGVNGEPHFDLQIPGGGLGIFDGCSRQFNVDANTWGDRYGGIRSLGGCSILPASLRAGCEWRFGWFQGADNPFMNYREVVCPGEIVAKSGCRRL